jgi:putative tricarboxylic transport membrane protein
MLLGVAGGLYVLAGTITYTPRPGQLGPDFWPKVAIGLIAVVSICEMVRRFFTSSERAAQGIADELGRDARDTSNVGAAPGGSIALLFAGIVLNLAYAALVNKLGFLLASFAFLVLFMYLGRIRSHLVVWTVSALGILLFAFVFLKVVYVSIPRGEPPFDQVTQFVMGLLMVR